jgi:hypothetical protein
MHAPPPCSLDLFVSIPPFVSFFEQLTNCSLFYFVNFFFCLCLLFHVLPVISRISWCVCYLLLFICLFWHTLLVLPLEDSLKLYPQFFECAVDLLCTCSIVHCPLPDLFTHPHCDELLSPPSASVSNKHTINFSSSYCHSPSVLFPIVFSLYFVGFLFIVFSFPCICFFLPFFPYTFSFLFLSLVIRLCLLS